MSSYRVALTASAEKELHGLPSKVIARIMPRLEHLAASPQPPGCKKLKGGDNEWRIRLGDYRIVYEVDDTAKTVDVTRQSASTPRGFRLPGKPCQTRDTEDKPKWPGADRVSPVDPLHQLQDRHSLQIRHIGRMPSQTFEVYF